MLKILMLKGLAELNQETIARTSQEIMSLKKLKLIGPANQYSTPLTSQEESLKPSMLNLWLQSGAI
jgi:hypothetical protein